MKCTTIYEGLHQWMVFGRDPDKPDEIIDSNQFLVKSGDRAILLDPGGIEIFSSMLASVVPYITLDQITDLFASHQDPDIISSLGLWDDALPKACLHAPWLWEGFIRHYGMKKITFSPIPDEGCTIRLGDTPLQFVPAHYLHSSGNYHVYDAKAKILMSGDVGAALEPPGSPMFVEDFDAHTEKMRYFHQRWMPSNDAKQDWVHRVRKLDIEILAPQHGRLFQGENVGRFLDWFERLDVGVAVKRSAAALS